MVLPRTVLVPVIRPEASRWVSTPEEEVEEVPVSISAGGFRAAGACRACHSSCASRKVVLPTFDCRLFLSSFPGRIKNVLLCLTCQRWSDTTCQS